MFSEYSDFMALQVDELSAGGTLQVITVLRAAVLCIGHIFITGTRSLVHDILVDGTLGYQFFQLPVYSGGTNGAAAVLHACADLSGSNMSAGYGLQVVDELTLMFCLISLFLSHKLFLFKNENRFHFTLPSLFLQEVTKECILFVMKKGLVLEGGAMRGMFTAGVMDVFLENNIEFDAAIGVSAGAAFGCNYKSKQIGRVIRYNKRYCNYWRYSSFRSLLLTGDIYGAKFCYYDIPMELDKFDRETFRNNPMDFYVVATDVYTGKAVYHNMTDANNENMEWLRASASMPMVSKPVKIGDSAYLDGGMADSIPLEYMQKKGFQKNVVILTQPEDYVKHQFSAIPLIRILTSRYPAVKKAMEERPAMYNAQAAYVKVCEEKGDTLVIRPVSPLNLGSIEHDPDELQRVYNEGRKVALERIEEVKRFTAC